MKRALVPLLPKKNVTDDASATSMIRSRVSKRHNTAVACERCRQKKSKCDGARPSCKRCKSLPADCSYEYRDGISTRTGMLKETVDRMACKNLQLARDVAAWEELFMNLQHRPEDEALELFRRLRSTQNPLEVLNFLKHGDPLLSCGLPDVPTEREFKVNAAALEHAPIRVPARPWTTVAQDGIVSELVSAWFKWDDAFGYPFLDRAAFVDDMRSGDVNSARYCSKFLVNALCAFRCFTSESMRQTSSVLKSDLRAKFYAEAKKHFDLDQTASIANVQGLWILFAFSCAAGTDRAGSMYRYAAYEMLKRMRLKIRYGKLKDDVSEQALEKKTIAKLYWGIFSFESLASQAFFQPSLMETPWMDIPYPATSTEATKNNILDMFGQPYIAGAPGPPMVPGSKYSTIQLGKLLNEIMAYITGDINEAGGAADLRRRTEFYELLTQFGKSLPASLRLDQNFTHQTCFLWIYFNTVAFNILRNLDHLAIVVGSSVKGHILRHSELDTSIMEQAMREGFFAEWSVVVVCGVLNALPPLVPLLKDPRAQSIFSRSCTITYALSGQLPILRYLLRGVQAMASSLHQKLPKAVQPVFQNLGDGDDLVGDVPTAYQLPHPEEMRKSLLDDHADATSVGVDLSLVIAKWSAMSAT